jgi:hypothetical protein
LPEGVAVGVEGGVVVLWLGGTRGGGGGGTSSGGAGRRARSLRPGFRGRGGRLGVACCRLMRNCCGGWVVDGLLQEV